MTDLKTLESTVLSIPADAPFEKLLEMEDALRFAKQFVKEIDAVLNERMTEFVTANGPQTVGDMLWCISADKSYKPKFTPAQMAEKTMTLVGGDWDKFGGLLASGAFKHGAIRKSLEEINEALAPRMFDELFETVVKKTVEGKTAKSLKAVNLKFIG